MKTKTTEHCQQITTNTINCLGLQIKKNETDEGTTG